jgi:hypothetical protein
MSYKRLAALLALLASAAPAMARLDHDPDDWCGTTRGTLAVALGVHDEHERQRAEIERVTGIHEKSRASAADVQTIGDVAVLTDDGSLFVSPNPVDVAGTTIRFQPAGKAGYSLSLGTAALGAPPGNKLDLGDDDARQVTFPKGFKFSYYGKKYGVMFVNSDGNITFGGPEAESTERSVQRFLNGPPRIAPFFVDLNPETASDDGGVYVSSSKSAVTVTWYRLPQFGTSKLSTFQATLEKTGRITLAYGDLESQDAISGIAPGDGGALHLVDFLDAPSGAVTGAIAEHFATRASLDDMAIANMFLSNYADVYDHLVVWLDFPHILGFGAFAYEFPVKNEIKGIGQQVFDDSRSAGSHGRLRSFVQMGTFANYPADPDQTFLGTNTAMDVLGQETGHRWLAFLRVNNASDSSLLGRSFSHWSFNFDSDASDMEGNDLRDNGNGTFTSVAATSGFSALDQYVMGLRDADDVPDMFYVEGSGNAPGAPPEVGLTFPGTRRDVTIKDIIKAEGPRVPSVATAPKTFHMAFILVTKAGQAPSAGAVEKLDRFRARWVDYFAQATEGRGSVDTSIVPQ